MIVPTYDVHFWLIGKRVVNFLLMLIELFSLDVRLRLSRYERKEIENRRFRSNAVTLFHKISGRRSRPPLIIFARLVRPINALQLCR